MSSHILKFVLFLLLVLFFGMAKEIYVQLGMLNRVTVVKTSLLYLQPTDTYLRHSSSTSNPIIREEINNNATLTQPMQKMGLPEEFVKISITSHFPSRIDDIRDIPIKENGLIPSVMNHFPNKPVCYSQPLYKVAKSIEEDGKDGKYLLNNKYLGIPTSHPPDAITKQLLANHRPAYREQGIAWKSGKQFTINKVENIENIRPESDICFINHAFIDEYGRMCGISADPPYYATCLQQLDCLFSVAKPEHVQNPSSYPHHDIVAVISEFWGNGFFHFFMEDLPRIVGILDILKKETHVKVHVTQINDMTTNILETFGIDKSRLITGHITANKVIYPEVMRCGNPYYNHLVALRDIFLNFMDECNVPKENEGNKKIITVIKRDSSRAVTNHNQLMEALRNNFNSKGYDVVEFVPSKIGKCGIMHDLSQFRRSSAIVAPHGAGLSNILMCKPGTVIAEIQTKDFQACYIHLALKFDLQYGYFEDLHASQETSMTPDINQLIGFLQSKLK